MQLVDCSEFEVWDEARRVGLVQRLGRWRLGATLEAADRVPDLERAGGQLRRVAKLLTFPASVGSSAPAVMHTDRAARERQHTHYALPRPLGGASFWYCSYMIAKKRRVPIAARSKDEAPAKKAACMECGTPFLAKDEGSTSTLPSSARLSHTS